MGEAKRREIFFFFSRWLFAKGAGVIGTHVGDVRSSICDREGSLCWAGSPG